MKASKMLLATLKEAPNEAVIPSHVLLLRAGMIRKLVAGVYNYLPLGLRVLNKVEKVIRQEMDKSGALEILSSAIQPRELWEESGRWAKYGPELMRFQDRHNRDFCLGPTHEEIFTDLIKNEVKSYKMLPLTIYQIQTKYRDELRPRFGLMRGREFIMKDAYSFDTDEKGLDESYKIMFDVYCKIFTRLHLKYKIVLADTGAIGGSESHQFMALSEVGESDIIYCDSCHYAADVEKAESLDDDYHNDEKDEPIQDVSTPNVKTIEEVSKFLNVSSKDVAKTIVYKVLDKYVAVLVRGDREINTVKLCNYYQAAEHEIRLASDEEIKSLNSVEGYVGPVGLNVEILVDSEVAKMKNFIVGANKKDYHIKNVNFNRDFKGVILQVRTTSENDKCIKCHAPLKSERGIEVGQIFKLKTKYSESMDCTYLSADGKNIPMLMGCYGIGVTRTMASIIEQHHDENGIIWPVNVAPYHAVIIPINYDDEDMKRVSDTLYSSLLDSNIEVVLDDRNAKAGFKFKDWELIGVPMIITVGRRANENIVEFKFRKDNLKIEKTIEEVVSIVTDTVNKES